MIFNALQFLKDYNIPYWTEGKNCQAGWVNVKCPFCNDDSNHGGFNLYADYYNCWQCDWHSISEVIQGILNINSFEAQQIIDLYSSATQVREKLNKKRAQSIICKFPAGTGRMSIKHKKYLRHRKFDSDKLERIWDLKGTEHLGKYKFRIIAPIYVDGILVSYQGRDITNKQALRYKACKIEDEVIHHKHIVYGIDLIQNRKGIIVEGITDVWRLGAGALSTFGTSYTLEQINFLMKYLDEAFILFDPYDPQAAVKAERLCNSLSGVLSAVELIEMDGVNDPGELSDKEARYLRKNLLNY